MSLKYLSSDAVIKISLVQLLVLCRTSTAHYPPHLKVHSAPNTWDNHTSPWVSNRVFTEKLLFLSCFWVCLHVFILLLRLIQRLLKSSFMMRTSSAVSTSKVIRTVERKIGQAAKTHTTDILFTFIAKAQIAHSLLPLWFHFFPKSEFSWGNLPGP